MTIKSLLLGSAAALVAVSGARAADAIVAEPEPVEYVRVCDAYGAGFFYIPGTETCLKIGGYVRFQVNSVGTPFTGYNTLSRFAPSVDVRSEAEFGTLRGFAELEFDYTSGHGPNATGQTTNLNHAFIEFITDSGTVRLGKGDTPYARFLGYGSGGVYGATYGYSNRNEVSYTYAGSNGFSAILALVDNNANNLWATDVEGGFNIAKGWGSFGVIAGYDAVAGTWGAKAVARVTAGSFSGGLHVFYSSGIGNYGISGPQAGAATFAPWSVLAHVGWKFSPTVAAKAHVQWFDNTAVADEFEVVGGLVLTPATGLAIQPEVRFRSGGGAANSWAAALRFNRSF